MKGLIVAEARVILWKICCVSIALVSGGYVCHTEIPREEILMILASTS